jgi:hypothetical protein
MLISSNNLYTIDGSSLVAVGNITAYGATYTSSDERWKTNVKTIENALVKVKKLRGVMYDWNEDFLKNKPEYIRKTNMGLIAQEVEKVIPEVINIADDGTLTLSYDKLIGLVINAVNELSTKVDEINNYLNR